MGWGATGGVGSWRRSSRAFVSPGGCSRGTCSSSVCLERAYVYRYAHIYMYVHTHTHTHTHTRARTHTHTHTRARGRTHKYKLEGQMLMVCVPFERSSRLLDMGTEGTAAGGDGSGSTVFEGLLKA